MTRGGILYLASFAAHGALAIGVVSLKAARVHEDVAISVVETKKPEAPRTETPPPPPPPPEPTPKAAPLKAKTAAVKAAEPEAAPPTAAPSEASSVPDFGLSLGGGTGGLAVAAAHAPAPATSAAAERVTKRVLAAAPQPADECSETLKKPKVVSIQQPAYTAEARDAQVAGKVRVEVTVDATGKVASARVLEGLGHGLDEAALAAARGATFEPGTKCGKPTNATFVIAIRFAL